MISSSGVSGVPVPQAVLPSGEHLPHHHGQRAARGGLQGSAARGGQDQTEGEDDDEDDDCPFAMRRQINK